MYYDCERGDWLLWLLASLDADSIKLKKAEALCANTVRHLMKDERSRNVIDVILNFCDGKASARELDVAKNQAYAAYAATAAATYASAAYASAAYAAAYAAYAAAAAADAAAATADYAATAAAAYAAYAASDAYASAAYAATAAYADAYAAARLANRKRTAEIVRELFTYDEVLNLLKQKQHAYSK